MTRVIDFFFDFRIRDLLSEENKSKGIEFYPLTSNLCSEATNMLYLSFSGLCFGWGASIWPQNCNFILLQQEDSDL